MTFDPMEDLQRALDAKRRKDAGGDELHPKATPLLDLIAMFSPTAAEKLAEKLAVKFAPKKAPPAKLGAFRATVHYDPTLHTFDAAEKAGGLVFRLAHMPATPATAAAGLTLPNTEALSVHLANTARGWHLVLVTHNDDGDAVGFVTPFEQVVHGMAHVANKTRCDEGVAELLGDEPGSRKGKDGRTAFALVRDAFERLNNRGTVDDSFDSVEQLRAELQAVSTDLSAALVLLNPET